MSHFLLTIPYGYGILVSERGDTHGPLRIVPLESYIDRLGVLNRRKEECGNCQNFATP